MKLKLRPMLGLAGVSAGVVFAAYFGGRRAIAAWVYTSLVLPQYVDQLPPPPLTSISAETCAGCHAQIVQDWRGSRMAAATRDPVFLEDFRGQGEPYVCLHCHAPLPAQRPLIVTGMANFRPIVPISTPNPDYDADLYQEGVTCVVCHLEEGAMVGPKQTQAPHATRYDAQFRDGSRCAPCHQMAIPPGVFKLDRPLADTHSEWKSWMELTGRTETCVDCHMPGGRHTFPGAWDTQLLVNGLGATVRREGEQAVVTLHNRAGHRYPSAEPGRALVVSHGSTEIVIARLVPHGRYVDQGDSTLLPDEHRELRMPWQPGAPVLISMEPVRFLPGDDVSIRIHTLVVE